MKPNIGLTDKQRETVIKTLNIVLADQHVLYTKTRNYHWNVVGLHFYALHQLLEEQYTKLSEMADEVAERTRARGGHAIGTLQAFLVHTRLTEQPDEALDPMTMIENLLHDHEAMVSYLHDDATKVREQGEDTGTEDLLIGMMQAHDKMAWMLRSYMET